MTTLRPHCHWQQCPMCERIFEQDRHDQPETCSVEHGRALMWQRRDASVGLKHRLVAAILEQPEVTDREAMERAVWRALRAVGG